MSTKLSSTIQLGNPVVHRGIVVAPLFPRRQPRTEYITLEEAIPLGFRVTEVGAAGSVPELLARNPLDSNVLLYDGEELVGAKQNRILNVSVLVAGQSETRIPVSCVEEGRWSARSAAFAAAKHTAYPALRRLKAERLSADPLAHSLAQHDVWEDVNAKAARLDADAPTHAQADIFQARDADLGALRRAFPLVAGQSGAILALGPEALALDYVSQPHAFQALYPKLLDGYLLDAIERLDGKAAERSVLESFAELIDTAPRSRRASVALGDDVRLRTGGIVGSGLEVDGELLQLCAFSSDDSARLVTRVARPSRRAS
jgi:ARG/rhodanese/phosphatase superfamily protein